MEEKNNLVSDLMQWELASGSLRGNRVLVARAAGRQAVGGLGGKKVRPHGDIALTLFLP